MRVFFRIICLEVLVLGLDEGPRVDAVHVAQGGSIAPRREEMLRELGIRE
jgi:hypothetical protein